MITKIELKNVIPYTDLVIDNLHKVSYIYGANGSGKTTLSHFLELGCDEKYRDCSIEWENGEKVATNVYNRFFRENNFGTSSIPGVFTLGQATIAERNNIEKKISELDKIKTEEIQKKNTRDNLLAQQNTAISEFREDVWVNVYKKYEFIFSSAFDGFKGSKENFRKKICDEYSNNQNTLQSFEYLKERAEILFKKSPIRYETISTIDYTKIINIENNPIWNKKIIGKSDVEISKLINSLCMSDWVHEGVKYLQNDSRICPFCQKETISADFRNQIEKFFDDSFGADIAIVKHLADEYQQIFNNIINLLDGIGTNEKQNKETKLNVDMFFAYLNTLRTLLQSNYNAIENKMKEPSRFIELHSSKEQLDLIADLISQANCEIEKHNALVANLRTEKERLKQEIWKFLIEDNKPNIETYIKRIENAQKGIVGLENKRQVLQRKYNDLKNEIRELNQNITSVQPTVDEINKLLETYGFKNFKIVPTPTDANSYQIQRDNGDDAHATLSEGEATFISFLYFLQFIKGGTSPENVTEKRVVVIDDPISSLDSNILFIVSSLIKEIIKDIRNGDGNVQQIIVLTHNVYFHKELSNIYLLRECDHGKELNPYYWILRKNNNTSYICYYEQNSPIKSSYELLWRELRDNSNSSCLTIQNIMRRILEIYFKTLGGYRDDDILNKFSDPQEKEICRSLVYWLNDGSHCIQDDLFVEQENETIEKYKNIFKLIFERLGHFNHYKMMMKIYA